MRLSVPRLSHGPQPWHCNHHSELLRRLHAQPRRIHASPHDRHCAFQHSIRVECKENKSAKSPRRSDPDVSILLLSGRGESSSSPSQSTTQPAGLSHRYMWYGAPGLPLQTPGTAAVPCPLLATRGARPASIWLLVPLPCWGTRGWGKPSPPLQEVLAVQSKPKTRAFQLASCL